MEQTGEDLRFNVLLVEDEPAQAEVIQTLLREGASSRCELEVAARLSDALDRLGHGGFDVVLLDLSLPDLQGLATYEAVRKRAGSIPIIVLTGSDDERLALQVMRQGAQDYLVKGQVDGRTVRRVIRYAIERKRAEEALREREEFFRLISENVHDLIAVIDRDGQRLYHSPSYQALLGDLSQLSGSGSFAEVHPEDRPRVEAAFRESLRTGVGQRVEYRLVTREGTVRHLESQSSVIRDSSGQPNKVVVVSRDITDRKDTVEVLRQALGDLKRSHEELKATQLQLIQSEKLEIISTFASGVAHEVRNPLQAIVLGIDYLVGHVVNGDAAAAGVLDEMSQAVQKADAIIRGLLEFSAHRQGEVRDQDLSTILDQSLRSVQSELANNPIVLVKELAADLPLLPLDLKTIKHIFINLFTNAIQSMPDGGTLTVRTRTRHLTAGDPALAQSRGWNPGDCLVEAEVGDTGAGILDTQVAPSDTQAARRSVRQGSGLGLTVVRKIIELYGGMVEVINRPEGGAHVIIQFKAQPKQAP